MKIRKYINFSVQIAIHTIFFFFEKVHPYNIISP